MSNQASLVEDVLKGENLVTGKNFCPTPFAHYASIIANKIYLKQETCPCIPAGIGVRRSGWEGVLSLLELYQRRHSDIKLLLETFQ